MKRALNVTVLLVLLLSACGIPAATQIPPQPTEIPPTSSPEPTATSSPVPTPTIQLTATPENQFFRDDFEGKLADNWDWLGEDSARWSLTDAPGFVRIVAQPSSIGGDGEPKNFLVRLAPDGNFEIETHLVFEPTTNFQFAGLLIYEAQGKALQFGRAFAQCNFPDFCKENALYFDNPTQQGLPNFVTPVSDPSDVYLRLRREGNSYTAFYSEDASQWTQIGQHTGVFTTVYVGLIASQAFSEEIPADFDYFSIQTFP